MGANIPDCQHNFRLIVGPLTLAQYHQFLPHGAFFTRLVEWVRHFVGLEYSWHLCLMIDAEEVQPMRLGAHQKLGWDAWVGQAQAIERKVIGATIEPDHYLQNT